MTAKKPGPSWKSSVSAKDYDAANNYLSLLMDSGRARSAVLALKQAPIEQRRVNDILRACHLKPLPKDDTGVAKCLKEIAAGKTLEPVQVVSFDFGGDIADGYHRTSACYHLDPFMTIPVKIAEIHP
jgi:hypothetical protein